ncbi:acyl-CoA dehydrogenase family protein [Metasolibacillus sp. FSL K6-0083]|uniref:acyl-CoA dehydrogenase family protein n=1 Tax=Metasolibacillus sp. FSL K6-0083 TaxID=2921416 RepID=UPI000795BB4C|nr:acyl-CoA dehydrogenase [[Bacillus] sp. KCTC 13219]
MVISTLRLQKIIDELLKPLVKKIDEEAFYAEDYLTALGKEGFFQSSGKKLESILLDELTVVQETAKVCMTTAFCVWCHLAALTYVRNSKNIYLQKNILPQLEAGELLGATALSNPMKYYAGLEKLQLSAQQVEGGYIVNGVLPAVSNLGDKHLFGAIAAVGEHEIMFLVSTKQENLQLQSKTHFIGVNGSATYSCRFSNVFIPQQQVISEDARSFCNLIRPTFIFYQVALGLGVMEAVAEGIEKVKAKQNGCNEFLQVQAAQVKSKQELLSAKLQKLVSENCLTLEEIVSIRLTTVYDTLSAVQANMIHHGAQGYVVGSVPSRKLREAYFFANLTPTVRQLEKMKAQ